MVALGNVTLIQKNSEASTVYGHIQTWLKNNASLSENTQIGYERYIRMFFNVIGNGKRIEDLEPEDLKIDLPLMLEFQNLLVKSGEYKNSTINFIINSIRSLYNYLSVLDEYKIKIGFFKRVRNLPDDTLHIGILTPEESLSLSEQALSEKHNGLMKKALILIAATTSIRKDAITNLKLSHIRKDPEIKGRYIIENEELFDKGKLVCKDINEDIYNLLVKVHQNKKEDMNIFNISHSGIDQMMERLCKRCGIDRKRRISFHSLKKTGVQWVYDVYGLRAAQKQAGHVSPITTDRSYLKEERNLAVNMYNQIDDSVIDQLTREEMIMIFKSFKNGVGTQIKQKAKELVSHQR